MSGFSVSPMTNKVNGLRRLVNFKVAYISYTIYYLTGGSGREASEFQ